MFEAFIFVLTWQGPMAVKDTRGPYQTEARCEARLEEMKAEIVELMPVLGINGKCKQDGLGA